MRVKAAEGIWRVGCATYSDSVHYPGADGKFRTARMVMTPIEFWLERPGRGQRKPKNRGDSAA